MTDKGIRTAFSRFMSDYGMVFVLVLLCVFFSYVTYKKQSPAGATAGQMLANDILAKHSGARVVILAVESEEARAFGDALQRNLEAGGASVVQRIHGNAPALNKALAGLAENGTAVDIIACSEKIADRPFVQNRASRYANLAHTKVLTPKAYYWPDFLKVSNLHGVANRIPVIAIIAIGMTLVIITAGIDLSVGSLIALSAVLTAFCIRKFAGAEEATTEGMVLCCFAGAGACALLGGFSGSMVTFLGVPAFIATLSMMLIASGLAYILSDSESIYQVPESFTAFGRGSFLGLQNPVVLTILLYIIAHVLMTRTVFGRYVYAVGGNREAARLSGVPVRRVLLLCYTICGGLAGVGGVIRASELKSGAPTFGFMTELDVIAAVVVGGTSLLGGEGKILGTLIGALIIAVIRNGMNLTDIESNTQKVVLGLVIVSAVILDRLKKHRWSISRLVEASV